MNRHHTIPLLIVLLIAAGATGTYYIQQANEPEFTDYPQLLVKFGALNCTITNTTITINTGLNVIQPDKVYPITDPVGMVIYSSGTSSWRLRFDTNLSPQALTQPQHPTNLHLQSIDKPVTAQNLTITSTNQFNNELTTNTTIQYTITINAPHLTNTTPQDIRYGHEQPHTSTIQNTPTCELPNDTR